MADLVFFIKAPLYATLPHKAAPRHAVYLFVVIKVVFVLIEWNVEHKAVWITVGKHNIALHVVPFAYNRAHVTLGEIFKMDAIFRVAKPTVRLSICRHVQTVERKQEQFAFFKKLHALLEVEQHHINLTGVRSVPYGELQAEVVVLNLIPVPFLYSKRSSMNCFSIKREVRFT